MKRTRDSLDNIGTPHLKRSSSDGDVQNDDVRHNERMDINFKISNFFEKPFFFQNGGNNFYLRYQNRALAKELSKSKTKLANLRDEVKDLQKKRLSMESLVSVVEKAWFQLDIDVGSLVQVILPKDSAETMKSSTSSDIFSSFIQSGLNYTLAEFEVCVCYVTKNENVF